MIRYRCPKCGDVFEGRLSECPNCHAKFRFRDLNEKKEEEPKKEEPVEEVKAESEKAPEAPAPEEKKEEINEEPAPAMEVAKVEEVAETEVIDQKPDVSALVQGASYFDGKTIQLIGTYLKGILLAIVTLGILSCAVPYFLMKWEIKHTVVDGHRLVFKGKLGKYFWKTLGYGLLTLITLGIYYPFAAFKLAKWKQENTYVSDLDDGPSYFEANKYQFFGVHLVNAALTVVTAGIYSACATVAVENWRLSHSSYSGHQLSFDADKYEFTGKSLIWGIFCIITLGIFLIFLPVRRFKWIYSKVHFVK